MAPTSAAALTRVKEAALLYDRIIFEIGLLDVTIGSRGSSVWWTPPHQITADRLEQTRVPIPTGAPFSVSMGMQPGPGEPATEMRTFINDAVSVAFAAEWHSEVLDALAEFKPEWVEHVVLGGGEIPSTEPLGQRIADQNFRDWTDKTLMPDVQHYQREFIYKGFNRDSAIAADLGAAFSVTPLFRPMLERNDLNAVREGRDALALMIPNVGGLPWEVVLEFREHPGSAEAREMLAGFEQRAADEEPEDALHYLRTVSQQVVRTYAQVVEDQRPKLGEELGKELVKTGVSLVPGVGPIVEKASTAATLARQEYAHRRSWTSALMLLIPRD